MIKKNHPKHKAVSRKNTIPKSNWFPKSKSHTPSGEWWKGSQRGHSFGGIKSWDFWCVGLAWMRGCEWLWVKAWTTTLPRERFSQKMWPPSKKGKVCRKLPKGPQPLSCLSQRSPRAFSEINDPVSLRPVGVEVRTVGGCGSTYLQSILGGLSNSHSPRDDFQSDSKVANTLSSLARCEPAWPPPLQSRIVHGMCWHHLKSANRDNR
jgi:hypothetical protein